MVNEDSAIFLVTRDNKVVSQFPIDLEILEKPTFFKNLIKNSVIPAPKKTDVPEFLKIDELRVGMKAVSIKAKIVEVPSRKLVYTRWGNRSYISNVRISDETGSIKLSLWNNQIDTVHIGDIVEIQNCSVIRFREDLQLKLGRKGKISLK
jgi:replication factor A1